MWPPVHLAKPKVAPFFDEFGSVLGFLSVMILGTSNWLMIKRILKIYMWWPSAKFQVAPFFRGAQPKLYHQFILIDQIC